jgi:hypothetical protein
MGQPAGEDGEKFDAETKENGKYEQNVLILLFQ